MTDPSTPSTTELAFPRQLALTRRFTAGAPRHFHVTGGGRRVVYLMSRSGDDPVLCLWSLDVESRRHRLLVDPRDLVARVSAATDEERARRERNREVGDGIVRFDCDRSGARCVVEVGGQLFVVGLDGGDAEGLMNAAPAFDPRMDPTGSFVTYAADGQLRVVTVADRTDRVLLAPEREHVAYGVAEFVAAEEMGRDRGHWWSPDGRLVLVARVDESEVCSAFISDPSTPTAPPRRVRYPFAGTKNADVSLLVVSLAGDRVPVAWDRRAYEYLASADWSAARPLIAVERRDQRSMLVLEVDPATGSADVLQEIVDDRWVDVVPGLPRRMADGRLVWADVRGGSTRLMVGADAVTPPELEVRRVFAVDHRTVVFGGSREPLTTEAWLWSDDAGCVPVDPDAGHVVGVARSDGTTVLVSRTQDRCSDRISVATAELGQFELPSNAEAPCLTPAPTFHHLGARRLNAALLYPTGYEPGSGRLPVLLDPYGGPHAQRVVGTPQAFLVSQWFADRGFAVLVADGRGTPGRGPAWEREVFGDLANPPLEDQVDALHAAAEVHGDLDLDRVAIRGWSFGGYLAALAVLRRPDVFYAAVAGAPVAYFRLYDTHYTERYLGDPAEHPEHYDRVDPTVEIPDLHRPLMIVHGFNDDNVLVAHSVRLSQQLTAARYPHTFLPLVGASHMAVNGMLMRDLLHLELAFLRRALGIDGEIDAGNGRLAGE